MAKLEYLNNGKNADECLNYLVSQGIEPISFEHDAKHDRSGVVTQAASHFWISVNDADEVETRRIIEEFTAQ